MRTREFLTWHAAMRFAGQATLLIPHAHRGVRVYRRVTPVGPVWAVRPR